MYQILYADAKDGDIRPYWWESLYETNFPTIDEAFEALTIEIREDLARGKTYAYQIIEIKES